MRNFVYLIIFLTVLLLASPSVGKTTTAIASPNLASLSSGGSLVANFTYSPRDAVIYHPVNFSADNSIGAIVYWEWDFGDGTTANATTPNQMHIYNNTGDMFVQLIVTDDLNNTASASAVINVRKINTSLSLSNSTTTQDSTIKLTATMTDEYGNFLSYMEIDFYLIDNQEQQLIGSTFTDPIGRAMVYYQPSGSGVYQVTAVFNGTEVYAGSTSGTQTFEVGFSILPYAVIASVVVITMSIAFAYLRWRAHKMAGEEPSASEEEQEK